MTRRELCRFIRGCKRNIQRSHERSDRSWRYWRIPLAKAQARLAQLRYPEGGVSLPPVLGHWAPAVPRVSIGATAR